MRKVLDCLPLLSGLTETISATSQSATPCASSAAWVRASNSLSMKGTRIEMVTVRSSLVITYLYLGRTLRATHRGIRGREAARQSGGGSGIGGGGGLGTSRPGGVKGGCSPRHEGP